MGQEIHREGLIHTTSRDGREVYVDIVADDFAVAMLRAYVDTNHPTAQIHSGFGHYDYQNDTTKMRIVFRNESEALAFHLRYNS